MNVPSYEFLAFTAVVAVAINASSNPRWRSFVLLPANLAFVLTFSREPGQLAPFAAFLAIGYAGVKILEVHKRRPSFVALLAIVIFAFCLLRRYAFVPDVLLVHSLYVTVGISYVFFRVVHLMVDAYQGALPERIGPVAYINYTLNFTCLVAGPIQLYADYRRYESAKPAELAWNAVRTALGRIVTGFFKVSVLSPLVWYFHSRSLEALLGAQGAAERVGFAALVLALFPVYLYFNFSGYTDVVIGAARFLRLELPENFNKPFAARGFIDFWSRWHMSLANWVKTYVYFPLVMALMRRFPSPKLEPLFSVVGYFVAFFLVGVWHGTTSMFVVLGVLLGLGVSVNKLYQIEMIRKLGRKRYLALCEIPFYAAVSRGLTFTWWAISALWFWSSWTQLAQIAALLGPGGLASLFITLAGAASLVLWAPEAGRRIARLVPAALRLPPLYARTVWYTALVVITVSVTVVLEAPAPHIVYRSF